jgi:hypothetical protein
MKKIKTLIDQLGARLSLDQRRELLRLMCRAGFWEGVVEFRLVMVRPKHFKQFHAWLLKTQTVDALKHAPCCPANHYHRARIVFQTCTCGAQRGYDTAIKAGLRPGPLFKITAHSSADLTERKAISLLMDGDHDISGVVLLRHDGTRGIVEQGAVRWLTNAEMWALMHPDDHKPHPFDGRTYVACESGEELFTVKIGFKTLEAAQGARAFIARGGR